MKRWLNSWLLCLLVLGLSGCMDDDLLRLPETPTQVTTGVFVVNEGNFTYGNASLSYYDVRQKKVYNDVFYNANNGLPLGDVAQSVVLNGNLAYIVVNNSGRIYVMDTETFRLKQKITGFSSPRYIQFAGRNKAYVSDMYAGKIYVIDPETAQITGGIAVPKGKSGKVGTEQMTLAGGKLFVTCWAYDDRVLVVDTAADEVIHTIEVTRQPNSIVTDHRQKLWVLCEGSFTGQQKPGETPRLLQIDPVTMKVEKDIGLPVGIRPSKLTLNAAADTLYFLGGDVYRMAVSNSRPEVFTESPYAGSFSGGFYSLGVDPATSEVYVADGIDFVQPGQVYRFSQKALPVDTFKVGIIPGSIAFKRSKE